MSFPALLRMSLRPVFLRKCLPVAASALFLLAAVNTQAIEVVSSTLPTADQQLQIQTGSVSFSVTVRGNEDEGVTPTTYPYLAYVTGNDIYGNPVYFLVRQGTVTVRGQVPNPGGTPQAPTTATIDGTWQVPNDGTLHNVTSGYRIVVAIYGVPPGLPTTVADLPVGTVISLQSARLTVDVVADLAINQPGVIYTHGSYRGADIIRFTGSWGNDSSGVGGRQSRPLRTNVEDRYDYDLRLSTDAVFRENDNQTNDDFSLLSVTVAGDTPYIADGTTQYRKVTVIGTPPAVEIYGLPGVTGTERVYSPQPDDGFLDIGESVFFTTEQLIPENYTGRYFVAVRVRMSSVDTPDASATNNIYVSNATNKIEILETASPQIEPASAISNQNGIFVQGGNAASDYGSVSEDGNLVVFASRASNLLVPPGDAGTTVPPEFATTGQQIFLKYRQTREVQLVSRTASGTQANADAFNPKISANGRYIAYDSAAVNLSAEATGNRSMIYVVDTETFQTVVVSRNTRGQLANGSSFNPSMSQSGRFVAFESIATNLELPEFTANIDPVTGRVTGFTRVRAGVGYSTGNLPAVTISGGGGAGATARANVNTRGQITSLTIVNPGGGYTSAPSVTVAPPAQMSPPTAGQGQVYLHDRDVDANGVFDESGSGKTATYLVSVAPTGAVADNLSYAPAVNLEDTPEDLQDNGGVYVAFASYGQNMEMANGNAAMIYRTLIDVSKDTPAGLRGPLLTEVVSMNDAGEIPTGNVALGIVGYSVQPAINGDGSQVAFTSNALNLVYNPETEVFDGDTNLVQDVFVRNFRKPLGIPGNGAVARISVSQERVATGTIVFSALYPALGNLPVNNPTPDAGESITISDGATAKTFTFTSAPGVDNVVVGATVQETRDNLVATINSSGLNIEAEATTPPNVTPPGTAYNAAIYLKNTIPGTDGNVAFVINSPVLDNQFTVGMAGGGTQAEDATLLINTLLNPFGSNQPSIDRSGRFVAFRSIADNLDVHIATDDNTYPVVPPEGRLITGELIRPLIFPTSNVYLRDRLADGNEEAGFDRPAEIVDDVLREYTATTRISLNKFGYPTKIFGTQTGGVNSNTSASSSAPALSADGRFVAFSSDSEGLGGLIFGPNNLSPLDNEKFRDVFIYDRLTPGPNPPAPTTKPIVSILSPGDGLNVTPGTEISINVSAKAFAGKRISSVSVFVNNSPIPQIPGQPVAPATAEPFTWTFVINTTGDYVIRAVATDNKGLSSEATVTVRAEPLGAGAPVVIMTQPSATIRFVTGSSYFLNARATAQAPASINPASVRFLVNELEANLPIGELGNRYGVLYTPTTPGAVDTFRARATDTANRAALSGPLFASLSLAQRLLPEVSMVKFSPATRVNAGELVTLQADALFPADANQQARVEFYVNNVFVGVGTAGATTPAGRTRYSFVWEVPALEPGDPVPKNYEVRARAVALNFQTSVGTPGTTATNIAEFYGSVVSELEPLPVYGVPFGEDPVTNRGFVASIYEKLFYERPTFEVWNSYVTALDAGQITRAQVVMGLMGYNATTEIFGRNTVYARTAAVPLVAFGRLPLLTPTVQDVTNFISLMESDVRPLPIASPYSGSAGSPWGATYGMATGMQQVIFDSGQFRVRYGTQDLSNSDFLTWLLNSVFAGRATGQEILRVRTMMDTIIPPSIGKGSAMAFLSELVAAPGWIDGNATEKLFQRQIHSTALNFQLNGTWSIAYGTNNPYSLAAVQATLAAGAKPQIVNNSAQAVATVNTATTAVASVTMTNAGFGYTNAPALTISAPTGAGSTLRATAATTTLSGAANLNVVQIMLTNGGSGYTTAPAVSIAAPPAGGTAATATATVQGGVVTGVTVVNRGSGYTSPPTVTIAAPGGSGTQAAGVALCGVPTARLISGGTGYGTTATVEVAPPTGAMFATGKVGEAFSFLLLANNGAEYFYATGLPPGLALDTATGNIEGIPTESGFYPVTVSASSWAGSGPTRTFNITVFPEAPTITSLASVRGTVGRVYTQGSPLYTITVSPADVVTTFEVVGLPGTLNVQQRSGVVPPYEGVIVGSAPSVGTSRVLVRATNAGGTTERELAITMVTSATTSAVRTYIESFGLSGASAAGTADIDGDGYNNEMEFAFGMNPTQRDIPLKMEIIEGGTKIRLSWKQRVNLPGIQYSILGDSNLTGASWPAADHAAGPQAQRSRRSATSGDYEDHTLTLPVTTEGPSKFYRARAVIDHTQ